MRGKSLGRWDRGKFKLIFFNSTFLFIGADLFWLIDYDFDNDDSKSVNASGNLIHTTEGYEIPQHVRITQDGVEATALKQIAQRIEIIGGAEDSGMLNYIAQYRESYDFWSGSVDSTVQGLDALQNITNQCAVISTAEGTVESDCADVGGIDIRVGGIPFLDPLDPADVAVPSDFPLNPPAGMF